MKKGTLSKLAIGCSLLATSFFVGGGGVKAAESSPGTKPTKLKEYTTGSTAWVTTTTTPGTLLQGGGSDNTEAFKWMINRSGGGDFVVIRANDSSGYNPWIYTDLGGVDSVTTLVIDSTTLANSTYVETIIRNAEALFIAGGDQTAYYNNWKGTRVESAVRYLIDTKKVPVGGTSAGMHVLGGIDYIPTSSGVYSSEALSNPYHRYMSALKNDFITNVPFTTNTVFDTHFKARDRMGRYVTFMARSLKDFKLPYIRGIAADEGTAVVVDAAGKGAVYGPGNVYFSYAATLPETIVSGSPLTWNNGGQAVKTWRVPGTTTGVNTFDLATWNTTSVSPYWISVNKGALSPSNPY